GQLWRPGIPRALCPDVLGVRADAGRSHTRLAAGRGGRVRALGLVGAAYSLLVSRLPGERPARPPRRAGLSDARPARTCRPVRYGRGDARPRSAAGAAVAATRAVAWRGP